MGKEALMSRHRYTLCVSIRWLVTVVLALGMSVAAQAAPLFVPVPEPRAADKHLHQSSPKEVLMSRHRYTLCMSVRWLVTVILALGMSVAAQAAPLFVPVPEPRAAMLSEHNQAIEHLKHLPTTKSFNLVRLNPDALQQPPVEPTLR